MLQPRETDIPALFLVLVVLPLLTYILLGKWGESAKKRGRISLLAQLAAEEAFRAEAMAAAAAATTVIPIVPSPKIGTHQCARCHSQATTRCSRCKSVRYCSGKCQIIHWRQVHKQECQQLEYNNSSSSPKSSSNEESIHENLFRNEMESRSFGYDSKQLKPEKTPSDDILVMERRFIEKQVSRKSKRELSRREDGAILGSPEETSMRRATRSTSSSSTPLKEASTRHKLKENDSMPPEEDIPEQNANIPGGFNNGHATSRSSMHDSRKSHSKKANVMDSRTTNGNSNSLNSAKKGTNMCDIEETLIDGGSLLTGGFTSNDERAALNCSPERTSMKKSNKAGVSSTGIMKMIGLMRSSKSDKLERSDVNSDRHKKIKMLFPYEEFVKFFQYEIFDLSPRGLVNCGNSCYANAVLQCLTYTKPLTIYLLRRSHSRACCAKDWCLMCELEQHVMMLRESGGPLSPSRILLHMRSINSQIGNGSQEDAHEFLRLLVTSMQSICLEGLGGENVVDPRLQETTFTQHTFGGRLRSKVKCLRCHHESERCENIMDLTLEIFGWVESLEDALTQFTSPEDLDGENMYRCGRCNAYVRAQKQLSIKEAPNILTIVLKRFQEGSYGKINKCITFPDMLDMVPFMTGTDDIPPLYMLYAVVVHLDTLNASFSGHYISYVKDLQGNWFIIDDTVVQPVSMGQVMSEGAYILFYMRSSPRPARPHTGTRNQPPGFTKHQTCKIPKSSKPSSDHRSLNKNRPPVMETYSDSRNTEFSDVASSDWSIFTSSDDASFTTESTRDSFSTVDYSDPCNNDPFSSIFNTTLYTPDDYSHRTMSCNRFSSSMPHTRFVTESDLQKGPSNGGALSSGANCGVYVNYGREPKDGPGRTLWSL